MESPKESDLPCCTTKDEGVVLEDETMTYVEDTQVFKTPAQEEKVSCPPLLVFDNAIFSDKEDEEEMSKNVSNLACYDTDNDIDDNIDEFKHVGRRGWDAIGYDIDPIYDIESHLQVFPLQLSQQALDQRQQGDEIFTDAPQTPKVDLVPCFPDDFWSYLECFDEYSSEHLDSFYVEDYQPPLCSDFDGSKNIVCLEKDSHDISLQPPIITLPCFIKGMVGNSIFCIEFPLNQTQGSKVLASEVTPGLLAGAEPNAHQFLCHGLINGVVEWKETQESSIDTGTRVWYVESKGRLDPTSVSKLIKGW
jgi:hypothetical protein